MYAYYKTFLSVFGIPPTNQDFKPAGQGHPPTFGRRPIRTRSPSLLEEFVMPATVNNDLCTGCSACVAACPTEIITVPDDKAIIGEGCIDCGKCVDECPTGALALA